MEQRHLLTLAAAFIDIMQLTADAASIRCVLSARNVRVGEAVGLM